MHSFLEHGNGLALNPKKWYFLGTVLHHELIVPLGTFLGCFLLSFVTGSLIIQPQGTKAVTGLGLVGADTIAFASSSSTLDLNITPTSTGTLVSGSHTLTANTNVPSGYSLTLSTPTASDFVATSGTLSSPTALSNNTWGYALPNVVSGTSSNIVTNGFDASYTTPTPDVDSKWANPTLATTIKSTTDSTTSLPISANTTIYYGAKADMTQQSGTYANTIRYDIIANTTNISLPSITSITPNSGPTAGGTQIAIVGENFTVNNQSVTTAVTIDGTACISPSISSNTPATGQDTIYCTTPSHSVASTTVSISTWAGTAVQPDGYAYIAPAPTPTAFRPTSNSYLGAGTTQVNNIAVTAPSGLNCTYSTDKGTLISDDITGLTAGKVTISYSCTTGSGNTTSEAKTGSWSFTIDAPLTDGVIMQTTIRDTQCTIARVRAQDARDDATYWIGRIDGYPSGSENTATIYDAAKPPNHSRCWMQTNLAYSGGGTNTYGDMKTIIDVDTGGTENVTRPLYMTLTNSNKTTGTTNPSTSTDGGATNPQYGYLYNWCAAMGAQTATAACAEATTPTPNINISICPSGWRLPTDETSLFATDYMEFWQLNKAINGGATDTSAGLLSGWLGMYSGWWTYISERYGYVFTHGGENGEYWTSSQYDAGGADGMIFYESEVHPKVSFDDGKGTGRAVRCVMAEPTIKTGDDIQTVTMQNCPTTRTRVRDARDDATYWVQKMADGNCWMLTNLAYGGGGDNTYGDVKTLTNSNALSYTQPYYLVPPGSNRTTGTTDPSTSTDGGVTNPQNGYLYNWCAAMGAQTGTSACIQAATPAPSTSISICPANWRLPEGGTYGEYVNLNATLNNGSTAAPTGLLSNWLGMYSGAWNGTLTNNGNYWSSTQDDATYAYYLYYSTSNVIPANSYHKQTGRAVRCVAVF